MGVRMATIDDVAAMSYIHSQTWKKAYVNYFSAEYLESISDEGWIPLFSRAIREKAHDAAIYEDSGKITGTITFGKARKNNYLDDSSTNSDNLTVSENLSEAEIISLYVLPEYWSTGQGFELMKFAVENLKNQGFQRCFLWVIRDNQRATGFYNRFGFKSTGELITVMLAGKPLIEEKYVYNF